MDVMIGTMLVGVGRARRAGACSAIVIAIDDVFLEATGCVTKIATSKMVPIECISTRLPKEKPIDCVSIML